MSTNTRTVMPVDIAEARHLAGEKNNASRTKGPHPKITRPNLNFRNSTFGPDFQFLTKSRGFDFVASIGCFGGKIFGPTGFGSEGSVASCLPKTARQSKRAAKCSLENIDPALWNNHFVN